MASKWSFYPQRRDPIRNPISGEFFSTEAVGNVTESLIREALQNTLDARRRKPDGSRLTAHAQIFLSEDTDALPPEHARRWFGTLWPHVMAADNGLRNQPSLTEPCPYLVYEDFGTDGLTGDPVEYRKPKHTNHFLNFFRAEGVSDKGEQDRGSWGVGKIVFNRTSRINSFIGFTVPSDKNRPLILGRSILKYHSVDGQDYKADGYFGIFNEPDFALPCEDQITHEFRSDFKIKRSTEPGLSIIVPWYDQSDEDGITRDKIVAAILRGFFYPILMGHLSVTIAAPGQKINLDADNIIGWVENTTSETIADLLPLLQLSEWAQTRRDDEFQSLLAPADDRSQSWSNSLVPEPVITHIRQSISQPQRIALRVPMTVQFRDGRPQPTFFNIFLEHSSEDTDKPLFIREELIIPDVRSPRISQVRALVIVENKPLASLLRDAETPAHTQWNQSTDRFKGKYKFGPGAIKFVSHSVSELLRIVNQAEQKPGPSITIDFFSIPATPEDDEAVPARRRKAKRNKGVGPNPPVPPIQARLRRFRIGELRGGFSIRPGDLGAPLPLYLDIRLAYVTRRGNPLKKYHPADFDLKQASINNRGVEIKAADGNRMLVTIQHQDFSLEVTGFDPDRDLYVKAEVKEATDVN